MRRTTAPIGATVAVLQLLLSVALAAPGAAMAVTAAAAVDDGGSLKGMSLEQLMGIEVTSVSKRAEKLSATASAIQVITNEMIRRNGAATLPQALRLAPNLQVAQVNAHDWAITARGFNSSGLGGTGLADKLLVMIDGRSIYTPLFAGVFWDIQNTLLEDIDRIEVVSGPGGTLWGSNAVNGVINIVSRSADETQGWYAMGGAGTQLADTGAMRYGGRVGDNLHYRIYGQRLDADGTEFTNGTDVRDDWNMSQGGFRIDYAPSTSDTLTLQGDSYRGDQIGPAPVNVDGQNVIGRWSRTFSEHSELTLQAYFDRTWRDLRRAGFDEDLRTYDVDLQHRFPLGHRHSVLWGAGYRLMEDDVQNAPGGRSTVDKRNMDLISAFIQDEIGLIPEVLRLTLGTKLEHNEFSGVEWQPSVRLAWTMTAEHTLWAAISRAVRSPSRLEVDEVIATLSAPDGDFDAEEVVAYEAGWRAQPTAYLSFSVAAFYNQYDQLRSININTAPPPLFLFANDHEANTWGVELSGALQIRPWWRLRGGYTFLHQDVDATAPNLFPNIETFEAVDPNHQLLLQSSMDLPRDLQLDLAGRYVDDLPRSIVAPRVPHYLTFDARLAWHYDDFEVALVGQNLGQRRHREFGVLAIPRSVYGTLSWHF